MARSVKSDGRLRRQPKPAVEGSAVGRDNLERALVASSQPTLSVRFELDGRTHDDARAASWMSWPDLPSRWVVRRLGTRQMEIAMGDPPRNCNCLAARLPRGEIRDLPTSSTLPSPFETIGLPSGSVKFCVHCKDVKVTDVEVLQNMLASPDQAALHHGIARTDVAARLQDLQDALVFESNRADDDNEIPGPCMEMLLEGDSKCSFRFSEYRKEHSSEWLALKLSSWTAGPVISQRPSGWKSGRGRPALRFAHHSP